MAHEEILAAVDAGRLMDCVRAVCTGERLSNEPEAQAFDVLHKSLEDAGCRVTRESLSGYVSTPEGASFEAGGEAYEVLTHPMTPSVEVLEAPLAYVPVDAVGETAPADVSGRIVLTDGLAMEPVVRALEDRGAAGVVFITGEEIHNMIVSRVWGSPTPETLHDYVGIPVASRSFGDGTRLRARLAEASGTLPARLSTRVENRWTEIPVITAEIRGADEDFVMVTGHVDSWGLGALDNASGNACAVELARILAPLASDMRRSVRFVLWSGHSHGRYAGSTAWCDAHFEELERHCLLNVNADCLGGRGATVMTESPAMASTRGLARTALREAAGVTDWRGCRFSRSCDQSFWGAGVPSIFSQVSEQPPFEPPRTPLARCSAAAGRAVSAPGGTRGPTRPTSSTRKTSPETCASTRACSRMRSLTKDCPSMRRPRCSNSGTSSRRGRKRRATRSTSPRSLRDSIFLQKLSRLRPARTIRSASKSAPAGYSPRSSRSPMSKARSTPTTRRCVRRPCRC